METERRLEDALREARATLTVHPQIVSILDQVSAQLRSIFELEGVPWNSDTIKAAALMFIFRENVTEEVGNVSLCALAMELRP